jgi:hypothetical protein
MAIQNLKNVDEYAQYLEENFNELKALFYYFLIGVTSFFREPTAFETLQKKVIPLLFINKNSDSAIRIWAREQKQAGEIIAIGDIEDTFDSTMAEDVAVLKLKLELKIKEERLKASNEELETSNEELKPSNEEMQSTRNCNLPTKSWRPQRKNYNQSTRNWLRSILNCKTR